MVTTTRATAEQVAEYFLLLVDEDAGDIMTNLRLQKLVYYAQAWHLAILDEELFEDDCEAWVHGPVIYGLYKTYEGFNWNPIPRPMSEPTLPVNARDPRRRVGYVRTVFGEGTGEYRLQRGPVDQRASWMRPRRLLS